ncbi:hypothetical protein AAFF_G00088780 [Aldrovandia affinis]|uniref:Uncharacterized protein n=1 Tax=Aldrovandia affinis TaxID=143900 RepID=A0AAD7WC03_9TELE|nr:hypothetical protein AAFF_G00088780 [Aldrovandia affinis]
MPTHIQETCASRQALPRMRSGAQRQERHAQKHRQTAVCIESPARNAAEPGTHRLESVSCSPPVRHYSEGPAHFPEQARYLSGTPHMGCDGTVTISSS